MTPILERLFATIVSRRDADPASSYTAALLQDGPKRIAKKLGEEAVETVIEAVAGDAEKLAAESADLLYHLMVLWAAAGVKPETVFAILESRMGESGLEEKLKRLKKE